MNEEEKLAYEWAKNQKYQSVAAQYAKILSDYNLSSETHKGLIGTGCGRNRKCIW